MQARTRDLRFGRSSVHAWGLFAREAICSGEFVIEYVGEAIRSCLEDIREAQYMRSGLGSSYLFRVDKDSVVDATKRVPSLDLNNRRQSLRAENKTITAICSAFTL